MIRSSSADHAPFLTDLRAEVVKPALAALLARAARQVRRDVRPPRRAVLRHDLGEDLVLLLRPRRLLDAELGGADALAHLGAGREHLKTEQRAVDQVVLLLVLRVVVIIRVEVVVLRIGVRRVDERRLGGLALSGGDLDDRSDGQRVGSRERHESDRFRGHLNKLRACGWWRARPLARPASFEIEGRVVQRWCGAKVST